MFGRSKLTLGDGNAQTSTIGSGAKSGLLTIGVVGQFGHATLKISGKHTIVGDGGTITIFRGTSEIQEATDADDLLIIDGVSGAASRADSLVINGEGFIAVALTNNAYVVADGSAFVDLVLVTRPKGSGCGGFWIAEEGGTLLFTTNVTGSAEWHTQNEDDPDGTGGSIEVWNGSFAVCVAVAGDVFVTGSGAKLVIDGPARGTQFCTTGNLTWESVAIGGGGTTDPIIDAQVSPASFGVSTCSACP